MIAGEAADRERRRRIAAQPAMGQHAILIGRKLWIRRRAGGGGLLGDFASVGPLFGSGRRSGRFCNWIRRCAGGRSRWFRCVNLRRYSTDIADGRIDPLIVPLPLGLVAA